MLQRKSLRIAVRVTAFLVCASARQAAAQLGTGGSSILTGTGGTTGTTSFATTDFFVGIQAEKGVNLTTFESARFFDIARCECNTPVYLFVSLQQSGFAKRAAVIASTGNSGTISVWLGSTCDQHLRLPGLHSVPPGRVRTAADLPQPGLVAALDRRAHDRARISVLPSTTVDGRHDRQARPASSEPCTAPVRTFNQIVQVLLDYNGDGTPTSR